MEPISFFAPFSKAGSAIRVCLSSHMEKAACARCQKEPLKRLFSSPVGYREGEKLNWDANCGNALVCHMWPLPQLVILLCLCPASIMNLWSSGGVCVLTPARCNVPLKEHQSQTVNSWAVLLSFPVTERSQKLLGTHPVNLPYALS